MFEFLSAFSSFYIGIFPLIQVYNFKIMLKRILNKTEALL